jgi:hypothetical protein
MAQHDYVIANASGASVRADINGMALAISSNNSGSSNPSTTYAYEFWADTSANLLKIRNGANNAWITLPFSITANNTVDINGGAIDGTNIGASSAGTGAFTTLAASGLLTVGGDIDLAGGIDVDGTSNLDVVDIDGAVDMATTAAIGTFLTFGGGVATDTGIRFDGNAVDYYLALDDSTDKLTLGANSQTVGSNPVLTINENGAFNFPDNNITMNASGNSDNLTLSCTDADANHGPNLNLYRNSASPADGDLLGLIKFTSNGGDGIHNYGQIRMECNGVLDDQEQGKLIFDISMPDGALANAFTIDRTEICVNEDGEDLDFRVESDTSTHALFVQSSNGYIGINNASPAVRFHVGGGVRFSTTPGDGSETRFDFNPGGAGDDPILRLYRHDGASESVKFQVGSHVYFENKLLVGQTSTTGMSGNGIESAGSIRANNFILSTDLAGTGFRNLNAAANGTITTSTSLRELKENIVDMSLGLSDVLKLKPREFDWKDAVEHGTQDIGFIADEVFDVSPKLATYKVGDKNKDNLQGVKYDTMTSLLVKAIQELKTELDAAKARIATLEG